MRPLVLVGILLIAAGGYVLFRGITYTETQSVLEVGEFKARVEEKRTVPPWIGAVAAAAGVLLVVGGARRSA